MPQGTKISPTFCISVYIICYCEVQIQHVIIIKYCCNDRKKAGEEKGDQYRTNSLHLTHQKFLHTFFTRRTSEDLGEAQFCSRKSKDMREAILALRLIIEVGTNSHK